MIQTFSAPSPDLMARCGSHSPDDEFDEPEMDGTRHLSISSDSTIDSMTSEEAITPPQSPVPTVRISKHGEEENSSDTAHDQFGKQKTLVDLLPNLTLDDAITLREFGSNTPTPGNITGKPAHSGPATPVVTFSPSLSPFQTFKPVSNDSPGLAARRAAAGKLPNKALVSLQQMRFDASRDAGMGLGVEPGSAASFEGIEGVSPGFPAVSPMAAPGTTFKFELGSNNEATLLPALNSPDLAGRITGIHPQTRNSPTRPKFKPELRGGKKLDKLNFSSPKLSARMGGAAPPSPLILRSSAFSSYTVTGPLTPLTPSHIPGAPDLGTEKSSFDFFSFAADTPLASPAILSSSAGSKHTSYFPSTSPTSNWTGLAPSSPLASSFSERI